MFADIKLSNESKESIPANLMIHDFVNYQRRDLEMSRSRTEKQTQLNQLSRDDNVTTEITGFGFKGVVASIK